jgi:drug/metabolite transporter (DMT)-like permease
MADRPALALAFALLAAAGYGFLPVLAKLGHLGGVPPIDSTLFRTAAAVAVYGGIVWWSRWRLAIGGRNALPLAGLTLSTFAISTGYLASVQFVPVGVAVIVFFTFPVILLLLSPLLERTPIGRMRLALAGVAFAGLAIAIGPNLEALDPRGLALAGLASLGAVMQFHSARALGGTMNPVAFALIAHLGFLPFSLALAWWIGGGAIATLGPGVTLQGHLALGALSLLYVAGFILQMTACTLAPASRVAPLFNLEPVTTMALAAVLLGETLTISQYAGGAMVLAAVVAIGLADRAAAKPEITS